MPKGQRLGKPCIVLGCIVQCQVEIYGGTRIGIHSGTQCCELDRVWTYMGIRVTFRSGTGAFDEICLLDSTSQNELTVILCFISAGGALVERQKQLDAKVAFFRTRAFAPSTQKSY